MIKSFNPVSAVVMPVGRVVGLLLLILVNSCSPITGGPCSYEDIRFRCEITGLEMLRDGACKIYFKSQNHAAHISYPHPTDSDQISSVVIMRPAGGRIDSVWLRGSRINIGASFTMVASVIRRGACTPIRYRELIFPSQVATFIVR